MSRQIPENVLVDLRRRNLDIGYLDRMALSPFLPASGGWTPPHAGPGFMYIGPVPAPHPVMSYMMSGKVPPSDEAARAILRKAANSAVTWSDLEVKSAGTELLRRLDEVT